MGKRKSSKQEVEENDGDELFGKEGGLIIGVDDDPVETEHNDDLPDVPEKKEEPEKKPKRKRKSKADAHDGKDSGVASSSAPPAKKSKKDQILEDFMITQLPALRKEIKLKKKEQSAFNIRDYPQYFKTGSEFLPTYCLGLFNFLGKNEIVCTQYGVFQGSRHMVKTVDGFNHGNLIISSLGASDTLSSDEIEHMMKRFGREWFKIPAKDAPRVASAYRYGDSHHFKVILTGIYEDSFFNEDGSEVKTANPVLRFEPVRAVSQKAKAKAKSSEEIVDQE
jgi:hypothetical protein